MSDKIILTGIEVYGYHGCTPEERKLGQKFFVDVEIDLIDADFNDDISKALDYVKILECVEKIVGGEPCNLIETVVENLAAKILADFELVDGVTITLHKPNAPLKFKYVDAAVKIYRKR